MFKSEKGMTFMVLVITIIVLGIVASAVATSAVSTYNEAKVKIYVKEMDAIQEKVNLYAEKEKAGIASYKMDGEGFGTPAADNAVARNTLQILDKRGCLQGSTVGDAIKDGEGVEAADLNSQYEARYANFRFIGTAGLKSILGLDEIDRPVIVDISTKKVYSLNPMKYKGTDYYSVDDLRAVKKYDNISSN